jgi:hypothetical protein
VSVGDDRRASGRNRRVVDRVVALRRAAGADVPEAEPAEVVAESEDLDRDDLMNRLDRLEQAFEGVRDAVHREAERRDEEIAELRRQVQPHAMARSLNDDARKRGL